MGLFYSSRWSGAFPIYINANPIRKPKSQNIEKHSGFFSDPGETRILSTLCSELLQNYTNSGG